MNSITFYSIYVLMLSNYYMNCNVFLKIYQSLCWNVPARAFFLMYYEKLNSGHNIRKWQGFYKGGCLT